ncbi:MAG: type IX secretion system protein PorQ [Prevotella sp.]|nr:type IX secretion system protein PorQ [Prevotella sp.]
MKNIASITALLLLSLPLAAQESQTVYNFLRIPVSAHAAALGGENVSLIEDDASLALSNPALLSSVSHQTVSFGYMNYMSGTSMYTANYTHVLNDKATIGGAVHYLNYGSMAETDYNGQETGTFSPSDLTIEGLFSYTLANNIVGGIGAKFIYSKIGDYTSTAAAIDLGINYYNPEADFSASFAVKNLGGQLSAYDEEFEDLPIDIMLGVSQRIHNTPFRVHATFCDLNHWDYAFLRHLNIGTDVILAPQFYLAVGYNLKRAHDMKILTADGDDDSSHGAGLTLGGGLLIDRFKLNIAYGKYHVASSSLMFNASFNF